MKTVGQLCVVMIISLFSSYHGMAQILDVSGIWQGYLTQDNPPYKFEMTLKLNQDSTLVRGTSKFELKDGSGIFSLYGITGYVEGNTFGWNDDSLIAEHSLAPNWYWAKKYPVNSVFKVGDSLILECFDPTVENGWGFNKLLYVVNTSLNYHIRKIRASKLYVKEPPKPHDSVLPAPPVLKDTSNKPADQLPPRPIKVEKIFEVISDSLELLFYDNGTIDDDTITVYYNKKLLTEKRRVSQEALRLKVPVISNEDNLLIMYAVNLGSIPPNTALLTFKDNGIRQEVKISSYSTSSGAIIFRKKQKE